MPTTHVHMSMPKVATAVYDAWLAHQNASVSRGHEQITDDVSKSYRYIWLRWCKYLCSSNSVEFESARWQSASSEQLLSFLSSGMLRTRTGTPSKTSQRRYWSVLSRVYAYAHSNGWVSSNPAEDISPAEKPPSERPEGAVLTPLQYEACFKVLPPALGTPLEARDRAMFLLVLNLGLTPQEIRELCVMDLDREPSTGRITHVCISPNRSTHQSRRMAVDRGTSDALMFWLTQRHQFSCLQELLGSMPKDGITKNDRHAVTTLFISRKQPAVSMGTLRYVTEALIKKACDSLKQDPPTRCGPQTIRNTVLIKWLGEGIDSGMVAKMAGLKNAKGLYHLRAHVSQDVRAHLAVANKRDDELLRSAFQ